jgi:hypothetical protein
MRFVYSNHQSSIVNEMGGGVDICLFAAENPLAEFGLPKIEKIAYIKGQKQCDADRVESLAQSSKGG